MKITDIVKSGSGSLSFEVFPPKTNDKYESVSRAVKDISSLSPSYMSVTYGAGGGTSAYTVQIAKEISSYGVTTLAHLTCVSSTKEEIEMRIAELKSVGVENILALRGDIPNGMDKSNLEYRYAYELIDDIKAHGDFCIGGACYPEGHPESESLNNDILFLKNKVAHGCDFFTTQMFFDNDVYYRFIEIAKGAGINVPIIAGIMPVTNVNQLNRIAILSGRKIPRAFLEVLMRYEHDSLSFKQAGIEFACKQASELIENGFKFIHIYSMNKADVSAEIQNNLRGLL